MLCRVDDLAYFPLGNPLLWNLSHICFILGLQQIKVCEPIEGTAGNLIYREICLFYLYHSTLSQKAAIFGNHILSAGGKSAMRDHLFIIWGWVKTYEITIVGGRTIHSPAILGYHPDTRVLTHNHLFQRFGAFHHKFIWVCWKGGVFP